MGFSIVGAMLDAGTGRVAEARESSRAGLAVAERLADVTHTIKHRGTLGLVALCVGEVSEAAQWLGPATDELLRQGIVELGFYGSIVADEVEALVALGQLERAERLVVELEERAQRTGRPWAHAMAARSHGLLLAAGGDLDGARASAEAALAGHDAVPQPFEQARTLTMFGALERRAKRRGSSRAALERAIAIFAALPAPLWQARAEAELARLGLRASGDRELSVTEARIAELAAAGRSNPEIAAEMFVSRKTVEANLSRVYRKLGLRSRVELARRLPAAPD
jgi:DNA-binding CsgD family transcriptional regulator